MGGFEECVAKGWFAFEVDFDGDGAFGAFGKLDIEDRGFDAGDLDVAGEDGADFLCVEFGLHGAGCGIGEAHCKSPDASGHGFEFAFGTLESDFDGGDGLGSHQKVFGKGVQQLDIDGGDSHEIFLVYLAEQDDRQKQSKQFQAQVIE